ncbi:ABC transporter permease [Acinetobacter gerneri]|uniref:ABC transporter permease n=1 Tax=Acinetobacter gerneri TaxID=202952 RepID=UPI0029365EB9|nr:ABC transporter permease [Acinetobacter gerneri]MDV2441811.1 ABC transporter permease [Acinetobacter gerneri]
MTKSVVSEQEYIKKNISGKPRTYSGFFSFLYFRTEVNQVALLAVCFGLFALAHPFVTKYANRVLPLGESFDLWALTEHATGSIPWLWAILLSWIAVLVVAFMPRGQSKQVLLVLAASLSCVLIIAASTFGSVDLVQDHLSRISLSTGAWFSAFALYILLFSVYQESKKWVLIPILFIVIITAIAPFQHWGIYREYIANSEIFKSELWQHIILVLSALPLIIVLGTVLGVVATKKAWLEEVILSLNGFMQTVPSIALYGLLLPLLSFFGKVFTVQQSLGLVLIIIALVVLGRLSSKWLPYGPLTSKIKTTIGFVVFFGIIVFLPILTNLFYQLFTHPIQWFSSFHLTSHWDELGVRGLGTTPALIALVLYGVFPLIVNVHSSLQNIPKDIIDAAKGIGLSPHQIFWKVELPLVFPFFINGIRLTCLMLISLATIAVIVNAGGLGVLLMRGTEQSVQDLILLGCIPAVVLALVIDAFLRLIEGVFTAKGLK